MEALGIMRGEVSSLTYSEAHRRLIANSHSTVSMAGQAIGPFPDLALCQLLRGPLSDSDCGLKTLILSSTGVIGSEAFAECFRGNTSLGRIDLDGNFIDDAGVKNLASALQDTNVKEVRLSGNLNNVSASAEKVLEDVLAENRKEKQVYLTAHASRLPHSRLLDVRVVTMAGECLHAFEADPAMSALDLANATIAHLRQEVAKTPDEEGRRTAKILILAASSGRRLRHTREMTASDLVVPASTKRLIDEGKDDEREDCGDAKRRRVPEPLI